MSARAFAPAVSFLSLLRAACSLHDGWETDISIFLTGAGSNSRHISTSLKKQTDSAPTVLLVRAKTLFKVSYFSKKSKCLILIKQKIVFLYKRLVVNFFEKILFLFLITLHGRDGLLAKIRILFPMETKPFSMLFIPIHNQLIT